MPRWCSPYDPGMTATTAAPHRSGAALVNAMANVVLAEAAASEKARTLTAPIVEAMWEAGLMAHLKPVEAGGAEPTFTDMVDTWQRMAHLDGSFGGIGIANRPSPPRLPPTCPPPASPRPSARPTR